MNKLREPVVEYKMVSLKKRFSNDKKIRKGWKINIFDAAVFRQRSW